MRYGVNLTLTFPLTPLGFLFLYTHSPNFRFFPKNYPNFLNLEGQLGT